MKHVRRIFTVRVAHKEGGKCKHSTKSRRRRAESASKLCGGTSENLRKAMNDCQPRGGGREKKSTRDALSLVQTEPGLTLEELHLVFTAL